MSNCDYNNHTCLYCGRCSIEAKKHETSVCHIPCSNGGCSDEE